MVHFYCMDQTVCFHTSLRKVVLNQDKKFSHRYILFQVYTIGKVNCFTLYLVEGRAWEEFIKNQHL